MFSKLPLYALPFFLIIIGALGYAHWDMKHDMIALKNKLESSQNTLQATMTALDERVRKEKKPCNEFAAINDGNMARSDIEKILEPENTEPSRASRIDTIKKRYEDLLVSYLVLRKCDRVNPIDYHIITSALSQEMASINAPGRLQHDILTSAKGSYDELYAPNKCDSDGLDTLQKQYQEFITTVAKEFSYQ